MVFSQLQLAYLYYLELSFTVLQNYRITAFVNLWLSQMKQQKVENQQQKHQNYDLQKYLV